ncbi:diguanylate cyclase domain-containing protein [Sulfurimonas sp.]|uniref:diguanylate cyclase domain-containing protein n=1 Tax=Sulfurimonas sp. TaxID=2022749 RepID=UPI0035636556
MFDIKGVDLESKTKEELIELIQECVNSNTHGNSEVYNVGALDKLKEYASLQSHIDKIHKSSQNVSVMMFRIYNIGRSDNIFKDRVSKKILEDITKLLKSKIRNTDILIKYDQTNFVIIAPNTDLEGVDKYAHKLNSIILQNVFGNVSHLKSNFSTTIFIQNDDIKAILARLFKALLDIEKDLSHHFIKV